jgi:hypothetical protein
MVQELVSSVEGFVGPMTQISTPKSLVEVDAKVMKANKTIELFQTMAIVNLNMGNLIMELNTLKNRLLIGEKEKAMLHEELDKEKKFQKGYKHNVEIWKKNWVVTEQKNKVPIKNDEIEEFKHNTTPLNLQDEELKNLRKKVEIWETTEMKWIEALFFIRNNKRLWIIR